MNRVSSSRNSHGIKLQSSSIPENRYGSFRSTVISAGFLVRLYHSRRLDYGTGKATMGGSLDLISMEINEASWIFGSSIIASGYKTLDRKESSFVRLTRDASEDILLC